MPILNSNIDISSEKYKENFKHNKKLSNQLKLTLNKIYLMGPEPNKVKHKNKGKLTARVRISNLIDNLNEQTKNFAQKIIDSNFSNFVGKEIDLLDKS